MANLTQSKLEELLEYDSITGIFLWRVNRGKRLAGQRAGTIGNGKYSRGYRFIRICGHSYRAHRLAWFYVTGYWPKNEIDHINGKPDDNRLCNLREATHAQNMQNARGRSLSGFKGVKKDGAGRGRLRRDRYIARIRETNLGSYDTPEEAHAAYVKAANALYGEFARSY